MESPTRLIDAARRGDADAVRAHLHEATQRDSRGWTALMHASARNFAECVKALIPYERGLADPQKITALMIAADNGHTEVVRLLAKEESRLQNSDGWTALMHASYRGFDECAELLLDEAGMQTTRREDGMAPGSTALMVAARFSRPECVELLRDREKGFVDSEGHDALWYAENKGVNPNVKTSEVYRDVQILRHIGGGQDLVAVEARDGPGGSFNTKRDLIHHEEQVDEESSLPNGQSKRVERYGHTLFPPDDTGVTVLQEIVSEGKDKLERNKAKLIGLRSDLEENREMLHELIEVLRVTWYKNETFEKLSKMVKEIMDLKKEDEDLDRAFQGSTRELEKLYGSTTNDRLISGLVDLVSVQGLPDSSSTKLQTNLSITRMLSEEHSKLEEELCKCLLEIDKIKEELRECLNTIGYVKIVISRTQTIPRYLRPLNDLLRKDLNALSRSIDKKREIRSRIDYKH
ncbi:Ankyrin repeat protein 1 [Giardia muris]|uniref:Ankyrin repeat protein 1 n=1 Tax=Giardia muris TaxID=5742 RepID=A0A4Z1SS12_GIAMU|nr:Ankyrin repeat protein 1 [Giardia muris]|eukprot:TNJ26438.1 Ankyrin repeat protein 1 [Giardia muris]